MQSLLIIDTLQEFTDTGASVMEIVIDAPYMTVSAVNGSPLAYGFRRSGRSRPCRD